MSEYIVKAMSDLTSNVSFGGGGGGGGGRDAFSTPGRNVGSRRETAPTISDAGLSAHRQNNIARGLPVNDATLARNIMHGAVTIGGTVVNATAPGAAVRAGAGVVALASEWSR